MDSIEKDLIQTDVKIRFPEEEKDYVCLYNNHNGKCYYKVNDEYLMIVNPQKVKEIQKWYEDTKDEM